jgi:opacity protein-like surface antigen
MKADGEYVLPSEGKRTGVKKEIGMKTHRLRKTGLLALGIMVAFLHSAGQAAQGPDLESDGWRLSVMPYAWFSGISGDMTVRQRTVHVDVGFSEIFDALKFGGAVHMEAQKGRWGLLLDPTYMALSTTKHLNIVDTKLTFDMWLVEFGGFYRLGDWSGARRFPSSLDVLVAGRYWNLDTQLDIGPLSREARNDWIDPFIGLRWIVQLTEGLSLQFRGDIGGFGIDDASKLTWNVYAGPAVQLSKHISLLAVYRALYVDREKSRDLGAKMTLAGPELGLDIRF